MSDLITLHPYDPAFVARYVATVAGEEAPAGLAPHEAWVGMEIARARRGYAGALAGGEMGANAITYGLARLLAAVEPVFYLPGAGLTQLEARFDRGIGMLMRPPSRLFGDAGLETRAARAMPIRLDASGGSMGGAFLPPAQTARFQEMLQERMERLARRMTEAEMDAPAIVGLLLETAAYAADRGLGLYEATDIIVPGAPESEPPGLRLIGPDRKRLDRELRQRLEAASRPPREPGFLGRLFGRGTNSAPPDSRDDRRQWGGMGDVTPPPERPSLPDADGWRSR
ncbi:MAG: hypothetical protein IT338_17000 [Thermomicrobiales bacterium]|nr:hypothetical protein [Thermomicrobiales bacterium]